jgi:hypothetical protein
VIFMLEMIGLLLMIVWIIQARARVLPTTLVHAWLWGLIAVCGLLVVGLIPEVTDNPRPSPKPAYWFAAWSLTFCPAITLLGIKRPQHIGWHAVTVSLWGILVLPAIEAVILRPGQAIELGGLRPWFLLVLILLSPVTFFAGRFAWPAAILGFAQGLFFARYLPWGEFLAIGAERCGSPILWLATSAVLAEVQFHRQYAIDNPLDRVWLDFRDSFGLFWGLRVAERVNAAAELVSWPFRLEWWGLMRTASKDSDVTLPREIPPELRTAVRGLLRRFVANEWLTSRWAKDETDGADVG